MFDLNQNPLNRRQQQKLGNESTCKFKWFQSNFVYKQKQCDATQIVPLLLVKSNSICVANDCCSCCRVWLVGVDVAGIIATMFAEP